ncbi:LysR family transcriptional regulator [Synechococcales cyanobacterium C]|uniref:LysR family transcriptional regulator n=1 Tax=Petrachloros mirabilis ULC683 TaxID=2781853 RepID=A0A8K1ZZE6_9CYAN|nr:LysR family transcriptional regulator [Petrachloros mirabilis]NCJ06761.1 LysR family transcriptional regulator [Petrachloros mirabilis ULC683]
MRLEQLQAFLAVAQSGSFQQAARQCGVTQSTISRQIQGLEADLGMPLFHRGAHSKLTLAGEQLLPHARKIDQEWQSAVSAITDLRDGKQPELCVAAIQSVCAYYLPPVLQQFSQLYPKVQLRVTSLGSDRSLKVLKDGLVDLAIVMNNPFLLQTAEAVVDSLYHEPIQVLMAADHPLVSQNWVRWVDLAQYPQVVFKDGYGMQRLVQEQFRQLGLELKVAIELNTLEAFRGVIRQGLMLALLPQGALVESSTDPTLAVRELAPVTSSKGFSAAVLTREVVMVTTQDRLLIPPIANFRRLVQDFFSAQVRSATDSTLSLSGA